LKGLIEYSIITYHGSKQNVVIIHVIARDPVLKRDKLKIANSLILPNFRQ